MTKQETFDAVARHLLTQKQQCMVDNTCRYRGPGGLKCAIGALIPDDVYDASFEGVAADDGAVSFALQALGHDDVFCEALQELHDNHFPDEWEYLLRTFAEEYGLAVSVIDEVLR